MSDKKEDLTIKKSTIKYASFMVILFVLGIAIGGLLFSSSRVSGLATGISANEAGQKVIKYINENLVQPGETATMVSIEDTGTFYKIITDYQGSKIPVYATKDGNMVFLSSPTLLNETIAAPVVTPTVIPKEEKANEPNTYC